MGKQHVATQMERIDNALTICRVVKSRGVDRVLVFLSGGKDSLATLDVCVRAWGPENVETAFMYFVDGLESVEAPVNAALRRYGGLKLHKVPHWELARYYRLGILTPPRSDAAQIRNLKLGDIEGLLRRRSGVTWTAHGWRKADGITRRVVLKRWGSVWEKSRRFYPIDTWLDDDVHAYLRARKIPIPPRFGKESTHGVSGMSLDPQCLIYLRDFHPRDYAKVVEAFPLAPAQILRFEMHPELFAPKKKPAKGAP